MKSSRIMHHSTSPVDEQSGDQHADTETTTTGAMKFSQAPMRNGGNSARRTCAARMLAGVNQSGGASVTARLNTLNGTIFVDTTTQTLKRRRTAFYCSFLCCDHGTEMQLFCRRPRI